MNKTTDPITGLGLGLILLTLVACGGGSGGDASTSNPPPGDGGGSTGPVYQPPADLADGWPVADAVDLGADEALLEDFAGTLQAGEAWPGIDAVAIAWRGRLVFESNLRTETDAVDEAVGNTDPKLHAQFSVSKSVASLLIGIAIDQGFISGVDVPYLSLFDYPDIANLDERKEAMRLADVLSMTAGFDWDEWNPPYSDPDNQLFSFHRQHHDWSKGLLDLPMAEAPGERFVYNTVASTSLGQAVENSAPLSLIDFASSYLAEPLQIEAIEVLVTPTGLPDLGRGLYVSARDIAKIGQLVLDGGEWFGEPVVSADYAAASVSEQVELGWLVPEDWDWQLSGYGYQWWLGYFELDGMRLDSFAARGNGEQVVMVVPALDLVMAVNARLYDPQTDDLNLVYRVMREAILPAFAVP